MNDLIKNINMLHTTDMGAERICRNLGLCDVNVVGYCKRIILDPNCNIYRQGKNWYCELNGIVITVNAHSYTIITAH